MNYDFALIGVSVEYCDECDEVHETPVYSGDVITKTLMDGGMAEDDAFDAIIDIVDGLIVWKSSPVKSTMH